MTAPSQSREEDVVQRYFAPLAAGFPGAFGLLDDCAALSPPPGTDLIVKTDPVRAGLHFFADDPADTIAWKALAVNASDLAAKGAQPLAYLAALSFPEAPTPAWLECFAGGLGQAQAAFGCHLVGGDTDLAPGPLTIALTLVGTVPAGRMVRRGGAGAGDGVFVTGTLGCSALGLQLRQGDAGAASWPIGAVDRAHLLGRYLRPQPRLALQTALLAHASASMDISDGLFKDIDRMCRASGTGCLIETSALPVSAATRAVVDAAPELAPLVWSGGDDYEVLCTVPPAGCAAFVADAASAGVAVTRIGQMTADRRVWLLDRDGHAVGGLMGWDHFSAR